MEDFGFTISYLFGMGAIYFSGVRLVKVIKFLKRAETTNAIVVKTNDYAQFPREEGDFYYPVVRFQIGQQEWVTQRVGSATPKALTEGVEIKVFYDPENPNWVEINTGRLLIAPGFFLIFGIILFVIPLSS